MTPPGKSRPPPPTDDEPVGPSDTLYVGGISTETSDSDLIEVFKPHGALDCSAMHGGARSYAFVFFRSSDEAKKALEALQGTKVHGVPLKIEFARKAKPYKHLWVGGISTSVTKEELEDEFSKFGKIEQYSFCRDRNTALVYYGKNDDAIAAQKSLNGKLLVDEKIRVDFQRPPPYKGELRDHHGDGRFSGKRVGGPLGPWMTHSSSLLGPMKLQQEYGVTKSDGIPSNVLWVGYPPTVRIDEPMLHNAMILFGEIERIKCFPDRNYSFVEFRSVDEARRAKEGLQGRLFNDSRIQIMYSNIDLAPNKDMASLLPGFRSARPDLFTTEPPPGSPEVLAGRSYPGLLPASGISRTNMVKKSCEAQVIDPHRGGTDFHDISESAISLRDGITDNPIQPDWRRCSPAPGLLSSQPAIQRSSRSSTGWDRELKRPRVADGPVEDICSYGRRMGSEAVEEPFVYSRYDRGIAERSRSSPGLPIDYVWHGIIAKGGTPVCRARCVPIGKGIDSTFPEVVNCSARTGLDMLAKHYAEASGFDIVFFLPDSVDDFASYTEFLRYLASKNRAGVAKFDDGTTLFLVPPSDFLTKVLNVSGPERLYGVVLNMQHPVVNATTQLSEATIAHAEPHYSDQQLLPTQKITSFVPQSETHLYRDRDLQDESIPHAVARKVLLTRPPDQTYATQSGHRAGTPKLDVSLTPELIATLASLLPGSAQSTGTSGSSSMQLVTMSTAAMHQGPTQLQGWTQEQQTPSSGNSVEQLKDLPQQLGQRFGNQASSTSQYSEYANIYSRPGYATHPFSAGLQIQDPLTLPHGPPYSHVMDNANTYHLPSQQQNIAASISGQIVNQPVAQISVSSELPPQLQQLQSVLSASGQGSSGVDADKNQVFQSTLQLAMNILQQHQGPNRMSN